MTNTNTMLYDKSVDRAAMTRLYVDHTTKKLELIVDGHALRVDKLIKESKLEGLGVNAFLKKLDTEVAKMASQGHNVTSRSLLDLFKDQVSSTVQALDLVIGDIWRTAQPARRIAEEVVLTKPLYKDMTLAQGWQQLGVNERKRIELLIRKGIAEGHTESAIANTILKEGYNVTRVQARGLVVTATTSVYAQADHEVYKANSGVLQGWQYVAVLDSRTTPLCAHRDGIVYDISDTEHLPPAHWNCRSTTIPIVKKYEDLAKLEGIAQIRKRNFSGLSAEQIAKYDGQSPLKESYNAWLQRQPADVQFRHLGDTSKVEAFRAGQLTLDKFVSPNGKTIGIQELRALTDSGYGVPGDTRRFAIAKEKLDTLRLGAVRPDDFYDTPELKKTLKEYYLLQSGELDGTLSLTNFRGTLLHNKKATKVRVLTSPPREEHLRFNPLTGRYDDSRLYQPSPATLANSLRLVDESETLLARDKEFIKGFVDDLENSMGINERAVVTENLRIVFGRARENKEPWLNMKAVLQGQTKFDVMNISDYMETQIRKDANLLVKLKQANYIDPVLGTTQLQTLHDEFIKNIKAKNRWEDRTAIGIGKQLRNVLDYHLPVKLKIRLDDKQLDNFYLRFAKRLALADSPDRDQLAVELGRDLYNSANYKGNRNEWFKLGVKLLDDAKGKGFYELETFGVQKRRMKSRMGGRYFGPYYDTFAVNLKITNPKIAEYAKLTRKVDLGLRLGVTTDKNKLLIRQGYKTYFVDEGLLGHYDTRIPITSTSSFSDFPASVVDKDMTDALNWTASAKYKIDPDFHDFVDTLLNFKDDKGKAEFYNDLNKYKEYIIERGDAYERFKAMQWLRKKDTAFSNHPFLDHRARIYERGLIGPQSGETFRPFLNTAESKPFDELGFKNFQDQIGAFLGGASDKLEDKYNSLSVLGRQQIAKKWQSDMITLGNYMLRRKPNDIRKLLEHPLLAEIDGEEQGKLLRFALESARIDNFLKTPGFRKPLKYSEGGTFGHNKQLFDLDTIFAISEDKKVTSLPVSKLDWVLKYDKPRPDRVLRADPSVPIVVFEEDGNWIAADGLHRIAKAKDLKLDSIPVKIISRDELSQAVITKDPYSTENLKRLNDYKISLALEQDASSSGAQIIALTTRNKQLAQLSNVVPTNQKQRLYDEIAAATFKDPRFRTLNLRLGLTEKDLRKAAKAQNMVTLVIEA